MALNEDVLEQIFMFCDTKALKNVRLTCKLWHEIINRRKFFQQSSLRLLKSLKFEEADEYFENLSKLNFEEMKTFHAFLMKCQQLKEMKKMTVFLMALYKKDYDVMSILRKFSMAKYTTKDGVNFVHVAALAGHHKMLRKFMARSTTRRLSTRRANSPLHYAAMNGNVENYQMLYFGVNEFVGFLWGRNLDQYNPLDLAIEKSNFDIIKFHDVVLNDLNVHLNCPEIVVYAILNGRFKESLKFVAKSEKLSNYILIILNHILVISANLWVWSIRKYASPMENTFLFSKKIIENVVPIMLAFLTGFRHFRKDCFKDLMDGNWMENCFVMLCNGLCYAFINYFNAPFLEVAFIMENFNFITQSIEHSHGSFRCLKILRKIHASFLFSSVLNLLWTLW